MTGTQAEFIPAEKDLERFNERSAPEVPAVIQPNEFITVIERLSRMENIPVDKIEQLFKMKQAEDDRNAKQAFNAAFTRAQSKIELVVASSYNSQTKSNYAKLKDVLVKAKPIYTGEGFSLMFYEGEALADGKKRICADIMHAAGHTKTRHVDLTVTTKGTGGTTFMTQIHGEGSVYSYGRRYLTCMVWNIPTGDDDDGNAGDSGAFIDKKQLKTICDMIKSKNVDMVQFLGYMGVEATDEIPAKDFSKAMIALKKAKGMPKKSEREPGEEG